MNYALIEENNIIDGPRPLPTNWKNISNLPSLSNSELKELGWLPVEYPIEEFDPATQKRVADVYIILSDKVEVVFNYRDKTEEEMLPPPPSELHDIEAIKYVRSFLKAKFESDVLFPEELK